MSFRPYLVVYRGRMIPGKRINFNTEPGVQFELYTGYGELDSSMVEDDNTFKKNQDVLKVYPTLTFRLNFRASQYYLKMRGRL